MARSRSVLLLTLTLLMAGTGGTQTSAPPVVAAPAPGPGVQAALERLFRADTLDAAWFTPDFAPLLQQVQDGVQEWRRQYGPLQAVTGSGGLYRLQYASGVVLVQASVTPGGVLDGLKFLSARSLTSDPVTLDALTGLYSGGPLRSEAFAPTFLAQVPLPQLRTVLDESAAGLGAFRQVLHRPGGYVFAFAQGEVPVRNVTLDAQGRFLGLLIGTPQHLYPDARQALAALQALPGRVSLLVRHVAPGGGEDLLALAPDALLAVGSAFKLAVLAELQAQVNAGQLAWTQTATLTEADRSLPSGTLQNDAAGRTYPLQELAERMIRDSDNTATNILLRTVGRAGVEARLGEGPILDTRELFALKNPANTDLLAAYRRAGTPDARRAVIAQAARAPLPSREPLTAALDAEWHVSTRTLCGLMNGVAALPLTTVNPGPLAPDPAAFARVSYKGGSDDGVLNFTVQVVTWSGDTYCVSGTWNDARPVNAPALIGPLRSLLTLAVAGTLTAPPAR